MTAPKIQLEAQNKERDAAFNKAMHGKSAQATGGLRAMFAKGSDAKQLAVDEYFKHWDNKAARDETEETRAARTAEYATLTRQYVCICVEFLSMAATAAPSSLACADR
jgi:sterol 24-C-methyltransferase